VWAGLELATGDAILVLHADTTLEPGAAKRMLQTLADYPRIAGGAFEMRFKGDSLGLRAIA
jgi:cellulose synthase/poly-beta-1,6-N-acetylglucosamine synthase-like glycosyltransferase